MSEREIVVSVENLGKSYRIWRDPSARLKAPLVNIAKRLVNPLRWKKHSEETLHEDNESRTYNRNRYFQDFRALSGVNLELGRGESIGIIGRNGSGKSTLLQMIAGTLTPTEGKVVTKGRVAALLELGAGFNDEFTGRENVYMNGSILGLTKKEIDDRFDRIAEFANIGDFMDQPIKTYSSGMRVRLAFSVQAEVDPDILIVDEALAVGDIRFTMKCIRRMKELIERDTTLLFVSHDLSSIVNFCKEVIWIHDGKIFRRGDPKTVTLEYSNFMHYGELTKNGKNRSSSASKEARQSVSTPRINGKDKDLPQDLKWVNLLDMPHDGKGGAEFLEGALHCPDHPDNNAVFEGGESIEVYLHLRAKENICSPLICCDIYNTKGSLIYGVNSCFVDTNMKPLEAGNDYVFKFKTELQKLRNGHYVILFGLSDGNYIEHEHQYGVAEALTFEVKSTNLSQRHHIISFDDSSIELIKVGEEAHVSNEQPS